MPALTRLRHRVEALRRPTVPEFDVALLAPHAVYRRPASATTARAFNNASRWWSATRPLSWKRPELDAMPDVRWLRRDAEFFGTGAVLYSPRGRTRLSALLSARRVEMQIDAEISAYAGLGLLDVLVVLKRPLACWRGASLIGNAPCETCDRPTQGGEERAGKNCWLSCGERAGACGWCGTRSACCRQGDGAFWEAPCRPDDGCDGFHCCVSIGRKGRRFDINGLNRSTTSTKPLPEQRFVA